MTSAWQGNIGNNNLKKYWQVNNNLNKKIGHYRHPPTPKQKKLSNNGIGDIDKISIFSQ